MFAFFGMNLDRLIGNYHKADVASSGIPVLEQTLQEKMEVGDDDESLAAMRKAIEKHRSALDMEHSGSSGAGPPFFTRRRN